MAEQVMDSNGELHDAAKMMAATEKKCPACGAALDFNAAAGKLKCPYCDTEVDIPEAAQPEQPKKKVGIGQVQKEGAANENELDLNNFEKTGNRDWGTATKVFTCKYCGAEVVMDANSLSTTCAFCGSNHVTEATDDRGTLSPGGVVPFKVTQQEAGDKFTKWIGGKFYAPKAAKQSAKAGSFQGVYLPYWTFDAQTETDYRGAWGIEHTDSEGHSHTEWHKCEGHFSEFIDDQLICASKNHTEAFLKQIEPFDTGDNKVYTPEYLSGFLAERYTVSLEDGWKGASKDIENHLRENIRKQIEADYKHKHADSGRVDDMNVAYSMTTYKYLLLPIWFSSFNYKGKVYQFVVNGQNGKVGGKYPLSVPKIILTILAIIVAVILFYLIFGG